MTVQEFYTILQTKGYSNNEIEEVRRDYANVTGLDEHILGVLELDRKQVFTVWAPALLDSAYQAWKAGTISYMVEYLMHL